MLPLAARMFEERYRRAYLQDDGRQTALAFTLVHLAYLAILRNDWVLFGGSPQFVTLLVARVIAALLGFGCAFVLLRSRTPKTHLATTWVGWGSFIVSNAYLWRERAVVGEYVGPLLAGFALLCVLYFAQQGPFLPRFVPALAMSGLLFYLFRDLVVAHSRIADVTLVAVLLSLNAMGIVSFFAADRHRRERFRAERAQRASRRELSHRLLEIAAEKERAEQLARAKSDFLATMSHEFRTPMNAVIGLSELLADQELPSEAVGQVRTIRESARALLGLLEDLLDFAKIDAGHLELRNEAFEPAALAASVVEMLRPEASAKGVALALSVDAVPLVEADSRRLRQVLVNLVGNAVKFTSHGSVTLGVVCRGAPLRFQCEVRDTGVGIDPAAFARIFNPFEQVASSGARRGTGLGLPISDRIVQAMGGELRVESEPGVGSRFWFEVPVRAATRARIPTPPPAKTAPLRILLVEDHPINQRVALAMLAKLGHAADTAADGASALSALDATDYDLVLLDLRLPDGNGLDLVPRLRAASRQPLWIAATTANALPEDRAACRAAGMDDFLAKPFSSADLGGVLVRALDSRAERVLGQIGRPAVC